MESKRGRCKNGGNGAYLCIPVYIILVLTLLMALPSTRCSPNKMVLYIIALAYLAHFVLKVEFYN